MTQRKPPSGPPKVEVIRRPGTVVPRPVAPPPPGPTPAPSAVPVSPRPVSPVSLKPTAAAPVPAPVASEGAKPRPPGGPPRRFGPRTPRPPPTPDQINALARKERVPARIAKGDLEGKMRATIWRKLHAEEARRFTQAYELMEKMPSLDLPDAFGIVQSGKTPEDFLARKARGQKKSAIKEARGTIPRELIDAFVQTLVKDKVEIAAVLAERTLLDVIQKEEPVSFALERSGRLEKLQLVVLARRSTWEKLAPGLARDPRLSKKPQGVPREPEKRAVADPRPFLDKVGHRVELHLRNGLQLGQPLIAVGPFDVLVGEPGDEVFVPLHAMVRWN